MVNRGQISRKNDPRETTDRYASWRGAQHTPALVHAAIEDEQRAILDRAAKSRRRRALEAEEADGAEAIAGY